VDDVARVTVDLLHVQFGLDFNALVSAFCRVLPFC
jgi:hypothetical protein